MERAEDGGWVVWELEDGKRGRMLLAGDDPEMVSGYVLGKLELSEA